MTKSGMWFLAYTSALAGEARVFLVYPDAELSTFANARRIADHALEDFAARWPDVCGEMAD